MKSRHRQKSAEQRDIAREEIEKLFEEAGKAKRLQLADRYVQLARKIAMKLKVSIPREHRRKFCRHCYAYLKPGVTCRVRVQKGKVVYTCLKCKRFMRFVYNC